MTKHAPKGYRIVRWRDGFYHVYFGAECIGEVLSHREALKIARQHKSDREHLADTVIMQNNFRSAASVAIARVTG